MPQRRTLLQSTPALLVERVQSFAPTAQWSPHYQVASHRFVLPHSGVTEFRWGDGLALLDGISMLCLPMGVPYQMQHVQQCGSDANSNIVVSLPADTVAALATNAAEPRLCALSVRAQWQLRRHWRTLARRAREAPLLDQLSPVRQILDAARRFEPTSKTTPAAARIHSVKRDIARRVTCLDTSRWTLHDVADTAGLSPFHLARLFKTHTGMTLHTYRQQLRLAMALQCLQSGMRNLADLAAGLGYSSQSHMGFAFQHELGVTPAQARLQLAG